MGLPLDPAKKPNPTFNPADWATAGVTGAAGYYANQPQTTTTTGTTSGTTSGGTSGSSNRTSTGEEQQYGTSTTNTTNANQTTGYQGGSQTGRTNNLSQPIYQQGGIPLLEALTKQYLGMANQAPDLSSFTNNAITKINQDSAARGSNIRSVLASRGLGFSPASGFAAIANDNARASQVSDLRSQIPLIAQKLTSANLGDATNFLNSSYRGQTQAGDTSGTSSQSSQQQQTGSSSSTTDQFTNVLRKLIEDAVTNGAFSQSSTGSSSGETKTQDNGIAGFLSAIAPFIPVLFPQLTGAFGAKPGGNG